MNEKGYGVDTVTCNIVIDGLCKSEKLEKAMEIADEMWTHGSAALGNLGNSFIGLVDDVSRSMICTPDLVTYSIIISALCKAGRIDEAKKKFKEMMGSKNQIFEIYGLVDEMRERGITPNVCTYNNIIQSLCKNGKIEDTSSILDDMLQMGKNPNISSFRMLIEAFCKACDFGVANELFEIALSICGQKEALYRLMFNELLAGGQVSEAKVVFEAALDRSFHLGNFLYKDLIEKLCKDGKLEEASGILHKLIIKGYKFDPASFMPVVDDLGKRGNKHEADELAEKMLEMASDGRVENKISRNAKESIHRKGTKYGGDDWQTIVHRDDGSGIALKSLKRVQKGWGQGSIPSLRPQKNELLDYW
ncbi:Pentatricopeptide repeat-containing protein [Hibiscus syriacus]|uniref:Pentatricopeptide repeat-containing protein n=1 Tax=Hibiscus syriacus TaxID=106335 RepID=A0A6A3AHK4_HIBSY|nr:Pentatricopeptide repeat-containing protein [Hibiscus syriacus]